MPCLLLTYQENDPAEIQKVNDMVKQAKDAANVWTDNGKQDLCFEWNPTI